MNNINIGGWCVIITILILIIVGAFIPNSEKEKEFIRKTKKLNKEFEKKYSYLNLKKPEQRQIYKDEYIKLLKKENLYKLYREVNRENKKRSQSSPSMWFNGFYWQKKRFPWLGR